MSTGSTWKAKYCYWVENKFISFNRKKYNQFLTLLDHYYLFIRIPSGDRSLSRACTLVSSWVHKGSVEGSRAARAVSCRTRGPDENRTRYTAKGPGCRAVGPKEDEDAKQSRHPSRPGPERGARVATGLCPLPGPFLLEHCPSFMNLAA